MKSSHKKQYTIRNLPAQLDQKLRQKTREERKSLNEVVVEALKQGVGLSEQPCFFHDLDSLAGSWKEDSEFEASLEIQDQVDPKLWS